MNCKHAEMLIELERELAVNAKERERLSLHLEACLDCQVYSRRSFAVIADLQQDSDTVSIAAQNTSVFTDSFRASLLQEQDRRVASPIAAICRVMNGILSGPHRIASQGLRGAVAIVTLALVFFGLTCLLRGPLPRAPEYRFDHLAAFSMRTTVDGRVYAALTQHESIGRSHLEEAHTR